MDIKTICKDCVFSTEIYDLVKATTRKECMFLVYNKLQKKDYKDVKVIHDINNEVTIDNHICVFCRNQEWGKQQKELDLITAARKEVELRTTLILYIEDAGLTKTKRYLKKRLKEIEKMKLKPRQVIIVNHTTNSIGEIYNICKDSGLSIKWSIENIVHDINTLEAIDIATLKVKTPYFLVVQYYNKINEFLISNIDVAINDNLEKLIAAKSDDNSVLFFQTQTFINIGKNNLKPAIEKLINIAENQECSHLIKNL
jgi:hypothetical protein